MLSFSQKRPSELLLCQRFHRHLFVFRLLTILRVPAAAAAAAAKSLQSCQTLCDPIDSSPPSSPVPGIFQARTLEWVAISFSNAWKWKVKVKSLSRVRLFATPWTAAYQAPPSMGFSGQEYWSGVPLPSMNTWGSAAVCWDLEHFSFYRVEKGNGFFIVAFFVCMPGTVTSACLWSTKATAATVKWQIPGLIPLVPDHGKIFAQ